MLAADRPLDFDATADHRSAQVIQVESLGKGAWAILTAAIVLASLALAVAWAASVRATLAEREARIAQDKYFYVAAELAKAGIEVSTDGH